MSLAFEMLAPVRLSPLERAIVGAVRRGCARGLCPRSIYLSRGDYRELGRSEVDGLPVRLSRNRSQSSAVYFQHGIAVAVSSRGRR